MHPTTSNSTGEGQIPPRNHRRMPCNERMHQYVEGADSGPFLLVVDADVGSYHDVHISDFHVPINKKTV